MLELEFGCCWERRRHCVSVLQVRVERACFAPPLAALEAVSDWGPLWPQTPVPGHLPALSCSGGTSGGGPPFRVKRRSTCGALASLIKRSRIDSFPLRLHHLRRLPWLPGYQLVMTPNCYQVRSTAAGPSKQLNASGLVLPTKYKPSRNSVCPCSTPHRALATLDSAWTSI